MGGEAGGERERERRSERELRFLVAKCSPVVRFCCALLRIEVGLQL